MRLKNMFIDHPKSVGETYSEHLLIALAFGIRMVAAGCACMLHGLMPFLFVRTGSTTVRHLHAEMITHRSRAMSAPEWADLGAHI